MARVPIYQQQVGNAGLPGFRDQTRDRVPGAIADLGRSITQGIQQGANLAQRASEQFEREKLKAEQEAEREKLKAEQEADTTALQGAYAELSQASREFLDDPRNGLKASKGSAALGQYDSVKSAYEAKVEQLRGKLLPRQVARFNAMAEQRRETFVNSANRYVNEQTEAAGAEAHEAAMDAALADGLSAAAGGDYERMQDAISDGHVALEARARDRSWTAEQLETQARAFDTAVYLGAIDDMVQGGRVDDAEEMFITARQFMDEKAIRKSRLVETFEAQRKKRDAAAFVDGVWQGLVRESPTGEPDVAELVERLANDLPVPTGETAQIVTDAGVRQRAVKRRLTKEERDLVISSALDRQKSIQAARHLDDNPRVARIGEAIELGQIRTVADLEANRDYQKASDEGQWRALKTLESEQATRRQRGREAERDARDRARDAEANLDRRISEARFPEDLDAIAIETDYPGLTKRTYDEMHERLNKSRRTLERAGAVRAGNFTRLVRSAAVGEGIEGAKAEGQQEKESKAAALMAVMNRWWVGFSEENDGRFPTAKETRAELADQLMMGVEVGSGRIWDDERRRFEIEPGAEFDVTDYAEENAKIRARLLAGSPATAPDTPAAAVGRPAMGSKVLLEGPGGPRGATYTPELEAWLAEHPEWKLRR